MESSDPNEQTQLTQLHDIREYDLDEADFNDDNDECENVDNLQADFNDDNDFKADFNNCPINVLLSSVFLQTIWNTLSSLKQEIDQLLPRASIRVVRDALYDLFYEYVESDNMKNRKGSFSMPHGELSVTSTCSTSKGKVVLSGLSLYDKYLDSVEDATPNKSELDIYLEEGVYRCQDGEVASIFDALAWWKSHELKFSILSKLARDVLSIPISRVASEATFSAGTRVLDPYRAKLSSDMVQVLICGADWVRQLHGINKPIMTHVSSIFVI
nr:zinc finger BED domain-containing protein RICESLEEPER 2-like [Ipomoea batatas]